MVAPRPSRRCHPPRPRRRDRSGRRVPVNGRRDGPSCRHQAMLRSSGKSSPFGRAAIVFHDKNQTLAAGSRNAIHGLSRDRVRHPPQELGHTVDLIVVAPMGELRYLGLEIIEPVCAFRQIHVSRLDFCRLRRHAGDLVALRHDGNWPQGRPSFRRHCSIQHSSQ